jgi:dienelactone hydrolase
LRRTKAAIMPCGSAATAAHMRPRRGRRELTAQAAPFDVMVYPGAKHGLTRQHDGRHAYATIKGFFDENLRP